MYPYIFESVNFSLSTLWVAIAISILATTFATIKLAIANNLKVQFISQHSFGIMISALVGARLFAIINKINQYIDNPSQILSIWDNNLNPYGAIISGIIYIWLNAKGDEQNFQKWLDTLVPAGILGMTIIHLGNFFDGQAHGHETDLAWGVNFENFAVKYTVPVHPTQIYALIYSVLIFLGLNFIRSHFEETQEEQNAGFIGWLGITLYSLMRFIEGFYRGDDIFSITDNTFFIQWLKSSESTWTVPTIRIPQYLALIIFIIGAKHLYKRYKNMLIFKRNTTNKDNT